LAFNRTKATRFYSPVFVNGHPHLSLSDIHAALAYYYDNQDVQQNRRSIG
jgi:uncharacterized protein (DUF433 family)